MPIKSEPELTEAIAAAKELFWRRGYSETSIEEVVAATGLNRYAIYSAFGGKLELFLAALEAFHSERKALFLKILNDPTSSPIDAIRGVAETCITDMAERGAGCLMCSVALDVGQHDPIVSQRVNDYLEEIRKAQEMALTQAAERDELNPAITPKQGAALLVANMLGASALARNSASHRELLDLLGTCIALLVRPGAIQGGNLNRRLAAETNV